MGRHSTALTGGRVARIGALILGSLALAHCSVADKFGKESKHSPKVIEDGEPVPKGGGAYRVGKPYNINGRTYVPAEDPNYRADGTASWYGPDFHGRLTANGEVYDMHGISAAHPTLPMPSYARVTNLENGRSIVVRINDRGPYARNRVIDLSIGTAKALKFYDRGLATVRVEYLGRAPLEGSDDRMLMATLREGVPAPAPSRVMVASAKPFVPNFGEGSRDSAAPVPAAIRAGGRRDPCQPVRRDHVVQQTTRPVSGANACRCRRRAGCIPAGSERLGDRLCAGAQRRRRRPDERPWPLLKPLQNGRLRHCPGAGRLLWR